MYITYKSAHPRHTIKNYVLGELKRYVRINTEELNYQKIKNSFFLRMRNRGFHKNVLANWFSQVKYSNRAKFLDDIPDDTCYYQGTRETQADTTLIKIGEGIMKETLDMDTKEAAQVASEDEDTEVSEAATTCRTVLSSKGSLYKRVAYPLSNTKVKKQKISACMTVLSPDSKKKERLCCIFPGSVLEIRDEINQIFKDELSLLHKSKTMRKVFENINVCAVIKNKKSIKNLVVKLKYREREGDFIQGSMV
jgi:hypothetical protein